MRNHHDEMRVNPDPSQAEELRQLLRARLASGHRPEEPSGPDHAGRDQPIVPVRSHGGAIPATDTDPDHREGDIIMLETEERPTGPRQRSRSRWLLVAAAAIVAVVVAAMFVAAGSDDDETPVYTGTTVPTTTTTTPPPQNIRTVPGAAGEFVDLTPGQYYIQPDGDQRSSLKVFYEVAVEGWQRWIGTVKFVDGGDAFTGLSITTVPNVVTDGCQDHAPLDPPVGPTVDDLATALTQLEPFEVVAPPTDVTLDGYAGKHLELAVPEPGFADCVDGELHSWISPMNDGSFYGYDGPGQTEEFWILDVEGTRVVLVASESTQSPAEDIAQLDDIVDSIDIEIEP